MTSIGIDFVRPDAAAKTRGETIFSSDYSVSGMLYGVILRSPVAAGRIVGLDLSRARVMPGVRAVICHADVPKVLAGWIIRDTPMFARDVVRYIGEPVAAVAADSLDEARRARDAIVLQIEEWTPCVTMQAAVAPGARLIHPDLQSYRLADDALPPFPRYANIASESVSLADPKPLEAAFAQAAFVVEDEFTTQRQYQGYHRNKERARNISRGPIYRPCRIAVSLQCEDAAKPVFRRSGRKGSGHRPSLRRGIRRKARRLSRASRHRAVEGGRRASR